MSTRPRTRRVSPSVEELEDRRLLSVTIIPSPINLHTAVLKGGTFTVEVLSDDAPGRVLLRAPSVTVQVAETVRGSVKVTTLGTPLSSRRVDLNHDGIPDLVLRYRGGELQGFVAGTATVDVTGTLPDGTSADSFRTVNLQGSGQPKHHHHKAQARPGGSTPSMRHV